MQDTPPDTGLPPSLRFLKGLVIVLMITMIGGVITIVGLLVTRMPGAGAEVMVWPDALPLADGAVAEAVTRGRDWIGVVTTDGRILIFNTDKSLRQEIALTPAP